MVAGGAGRLASRSGATDLYGGNLAVSRGRADSANRSEDAMPSYEFKCSKCGERFERVMTVAQRERAKPACPSCKGRKVEPVFGGFFAKTSRKS